jgi:hypothetical protein
MGVFDGTWNPDPPPKGRKKMKNAVESADVFYETLQRISPSFTIYGNVVIFPPKTVVAQEAYEFCLRHLEEYDLELLDFNIIQQIIQERLTDDEWNVLAYLVALITGEQHVRGCRVEKA